jgi:uncharacterized protein (TIGR03086 family)
LTRTDPTDPDRPTYSDQTVESGFVSINSRRYTVAIFSLDRVLRSVPIDAWDAQSTCEGWTVRDVASHAIAVVANVGARLTGAERVDPFGDPGKLYGPDPSLAWPTIRDRTLEALDHQGALQQGVDTQTGTVTMDEFIQNMTADALIHSWDIARSAGLDERLDPGLVVSVYEGYQQRDAAGLMRTPGRYGAATVPEGEVSLQDRLLAFVGRTP